MDGRAFLSSFVTFCQALASVPCHTEKNVTGGCPLSHKKLLTAMENNVIIIKVIDDMVCWKSGYDVPALLFYKIAVEAIAEK